jgi:hypothetical protein
VTALSGLKPLRHPEPAVQLCDVQVFETIDLIAIGTQILAQGQNIYFMTAQIAHDGEHFVARLAEAKHQARFRGDERPHPFGAPPGTHPPREDVHCGSCDDRIFENGEPSTCPLSLAWTLARRLAAQYAVIRRETSKRSSGGILFRPLL